MGKITNALKKAAEERLTRIEKKTRIKEEKRIVVKYERQKHFRNSE